MGGREGPGNRDEVFPRLDGLQQPPRAAVVVPRVGGPQLASGSVWELDAPTGMDGAQIYSALRCLDCGALGAGLGPVGTSKPPWRESQSQGRRWGSMCTLCLQTETPTLLKLLSRDKPGCIIRSLIKSTSNFLKTFWAHAYINSGVSHAKLTALQPAFDLHH